ncbi:MAG: hypothetical protein ACRELC_07600 [Gemmatimonadota bacterium]
MLCITVLRVQAGGADSTPPWRVVLENVPLDAAAIFVYLLLAGAVAVIWWANRRGRGSSDDVS